MRTVSLITATLNSERTLQSTLSSSSMQSGIYEHIFVDGGSTDQTLAMLQSYIAGRPNARIVKQESSGLYGALNDGVRDARGDYVWFLHSDDVFAADNIVETYMDSIQCGAPDLVYADVNIVDHHGRLRRKWVSGTYSRAKCFFGWMPPHVTCLARRDLFETVGLFSEGRASAADYDWLLRILWDGDFRISYIPIVSIIMRTGGASNTSLMARVRANVSDGKSWVSRVGPLFFIPQVLKPIRKISQFQPKLFR